MKQIMKWMFAAILFLSGTVMLSSCEKYVEDSVNGLFKPLYDEMDEYTAQKKQARMDNLFNWKIGNTTDQEAIDKFGYDNCFQVMELTPEFWAGEYAPDISPAVDRSNLRLVRCLTNSEYGLRIGGLVCDKLIAKDLAEIFRQLYEAKYNVEAAMTAHAYCKENLTYENCTYSYFYDMNNPESATDTQQQGLSLVLNASTPLTSDDLAVKLFKQHGFKWGGDEPNGDPNCFTAI